VDFGTGKTLGGAIFGEALSSEATTFDSSSQFKTMCHTKSSTQGGSLIKSGLKTLKIVVEDLHDLEIGTELSMSSRRRSHSDLHHPRWFDINAVHHS
jgi:hypothetical protein